MTQHRHRARLHRQDNGPGVKPTIYVQPASRSARWKFFKPEDVPPFDGASAWFEIDLIKGKWTVVAPVNPPNGSGT